MHSGRPAGADLSRWVKLIEGPELDPEHAQGYRGELDVTFRRLMSATFEATDPQEEARLAATEMWARLVSEPYKKRGVN